jgi:hypothetical protein
MVDFIEKMIYNGVKEKASTVNTRFNPVRRLSIPTQKVVGRPNEYL